MSEVKPKDEVKLEDHGICILMDGIKDSSVKPVIEWILKENLRKEKRCKHLQLIINSPGGSCAASFALTDIMAGSKIPIYTTGLGCIASCGFLIFIAGAKGHRVLTPNTSILSHQYSWGSGGKHHDLVADRKEQDLTLGRMLTHYKKHLGLPEKIIMSKLLPPEDVWLCAQEAKKLKICDKIQTI